MLKSVTQFRNALEDSGFREGSDGFMVSGGVEYKDVLNDFVRNLRSSRSYLLSDRDKVKVLNLLKKKGI